MLVKTTVDFVTENGECSMTFYRTPQEFDKTFNAMQTITGEKSNYAIYNEDDYIIPASYSISFERETEESNWIVHILNFLTAAGAHSTILKAIQMGVVFVIAASISII